MFRTFVWLGISVVNYGHGNDRNITSIFVTRCKDDIQAIVLASCTFLH